MHRGFEGKRVRCGPRAAALPCGEHVRAEIAPPSDLSSLPPLGLADLTLDLMLPQRELRLNTLGHYPKAHFADPRVAPLLQALLADLAAAEDAIATENAIRRWTSPNLLPSRIAQSIHVQ